MSIESPIRNNSKITKPHIYFNSYSKRWKVIFQPNHTRRSKARDWIDTKNKRAHSFVAVLNGID